MILYGSRTKPDYELEQNKDPPLTAVIQPLTQEQIENLQTNLGIVSPSKMMRDSWADDSSTMERTIEENKDPPIIDDSWDFEAFKGYMHEQAKVFSIPECSSKGSWIEPEPIVVEPGERLIGIDLHPQVIRDIVLKKVQNQSRPEFLSKCLNVPYPPISYVKTLDWDEIIKNARKMVNGKPFEPVKPADYDVFFPQPDLPLRLYDHDPVVFGKVVCTNVVESDGSICFTVTPASHCDMLDATVYAFHNGRGNGKTLFMDEISGMESAAIELIENVIEHLRDSISKIIVDKYAQYAVKDPEELKSHCFDGDEQWKVEENIIYMPYTKEQLEAAFTSMATQHTDYSKIYNERNSKIMNDSVIKYNEAMDAAKKAYDEAKLAAQKEKEQAELAEANEKVASAMKGLYDAYIAQGFTPEQAEKFVTIVLEKVHM